MCILGAGPGGSTVALHLARRGIACTLLDKATFPRDKICGDALSGKVVNELRRLDPTLPQRLGALPIQLPSWGIHFIAPNLRRLSVPFKPEYNTTTDAPPGFLAKRVDFDNFLVEEVRRQPLIDFREGMNITGFRRETGGFALLTADGQEAGRTRLLVAANGAQSGFARHVAGQPLDPNHHCAGLRAYYENVDGLDPDGFVELHFFKNFLPGYLWIFPLPNGQANVGVGMLTAAVSRRKINLKAALLDMLANHPTLRPRFAQARLVGDIRGFGLPLGSRQRPLSGDNYLLVGDAASLIDPFTGEGISNAMISGRWAAEQAAHALATGDFSAANLRAYDAAVYRRLGQELRISHRLQQLLRLPWLFDLVVSRAAHNPALAATLSCMFVDLDLREQLKKPSFYASLLFGTPFR